MADVWDSLKKDWQAIKAKGFKTTSEASDAAAKVDSTRPGAGQLAEDMKLSPMERAIKAKKGFYGK